MPFCFVFGCNSGSKSKAAQLQPTRRFFPPPKDEALFEKWKIKCHRPDSELDAKKRVCELHFEEDDIIKNIEITFPTGAKVLIPLENWKLRPTAVPSIFPNCPAYLAKREVKRKAPCRNPIFIPPVKNTNCSSQNYSDTHTTNNSDVKPEISDVENCDTIDQETLGFSCIEFSESDIDGVKLPSHQWFVMKDDLKTKMVRYYFQVLLANNYAPIVSKVAVVNFSSREITYSVKSNDLPNVPEQLKSFKSIQHLETILSIVDAVSMCPGIESCEYSSINCDTVKSGHFVNGVWRSYTCPLLLHLEEHASRMENDAHIPGQPEDIPTVETTDIGSNKIDDKCQGGSEICQYCRKLKRALVARLRRQKLSKKCNKHTNVKHLTLDEIRRRFSRNTKRLSKLKLQLSIQKAKQKVNEAH